MAGNRWKATTQPIPSGTAAHTLLQVVAGANIALKISEWSVSFQGQTNTAAPAQVDVIRQTSSGTMGTAQSQIVKDPPDWAEVMQTSIQDGGTGYSAEPAGTVILMSELVHPQQGYTWQAPFAQEFKVPGGGRLGLRVTAGASVNVICRFVGEE